MPYLTRARAASKTADQATPSLRPSAGSPHTQGGLQRAILVGARLLLLTGLLAWAASPFATPLRPAFAEPGLQATATAGGSWYPTNRDPANYGNNANTGAATATPTPSQYN